MSVTNTLFVRWCKSQGHTSANAGCKALGVERQAATYWKDGRNAEAQIIARMANDLAENPTAWVLAAASEKARAAEERRTLLSMAKQMGYAAMICLAVYTAIPMENASAGDISHIAYTLCIVTVIGMLARFLPEASAKKDSAHECAALR